MLNAWTLTILAYTITGCVSIFAFASIVGILVGTKSSKVGLKISVITPGIKRHKSIIKKKKKKHDKIVFHQKIKLIK